MKKFFRKFFFWDEPSAGAVFGYLLAAVSGVCLANILCFTGLIAAQSFSGGLAALTAGKVLLSAYCLFLVFRFFFMQDRAVWSVGKNKLDDNGVYDPNRHPAEPAADDLRALLIKEELEK